MDFDGLSLVGLSQSGLLALTVLLVLTDRLVWHGRLKEKQKVNDEQAKLIKDLTEQNTLLLRSSVPTVNAVMGALHRAAGEERESP